MRLLRVLCRLVMPSLLSMMLSMTVLSVARAQDQHDNKQDEKHPQPAAQPQNQPRQQEQPRPQEQPRQQPQQRQQRQETPPAQPRPQEQPRTQQQPQAPVQENKNRQEQHGARQQEQPPAQANQNRQQPQRAQQPPQPQRAQQQQPPQRTQQQPQQQRPAQTNDNRQAQQGTRQQEQRPQRQVQPNSNRQKEAGGQAPQSVRGAVPRAQTFQAARRVPQAQEGSIFQQRRAHNWQSDHRTWQQRGGYVGYRVPDERFRVYFGPTHYFHIYSLPIVYVGGYPEFQYNGYWFELLDPVPEYWGPDWYQTDDVYVNYDPNDGGYYLYDTRYPDVRLAIEFAEG